MRVVFILMFLKNFPAKQKTMINGISQNKAITLITKNNKIKT